MLCFYFRQSGGPQFGAGLRGPVPPAPATTAKQKSGTLSRPPAPPMAPPAAPPMAPPSAPPAAPPPSAAPPPPSSGGGGGGLAAALQGAQLKKVAQVS